MEEREDMRGKKNHMVGSCWPHTTADENSRGGVCLTIYDHSHPGFFFLLVTIPLLALPGHGVEEALSQVAPNLLTRAFLHEIKVRATSEEGGRCLLVWAENSEEGR